MSSFYSFLFNSFPAFYCISRHFLALFNNTKTTTYVFWFFLCVLFLFLFCFLFFVFLHLVKVEKGLYFLGGGTV